MTLQPPPPPVRVRTPSTGTPLTPPPVSVAPIATGEIVYVRCRVVGEKPVNEEFDGKENAWEVQTIDADGNEVIPDYRLFLTVREIMRLAQAKVVVCKTPA